MDRKEYIKEWYGKNKERLSEKRKGKRKEEHAKSYARLLELKGREYINQKSKEWREKNPDKVKEIQRKSRASNPARRLVNLARNRCNKSGVEFSITEADVIIPDVCPLLGVPLSVFGDKDYVPSLDRIDTTRGYTPDNIWVISFKANRMKNTASVSELLTFSKNVLNVFGDIE